MKKKINTDDYLLVVDDSKIMEGDFYFIESKKKIAVCASGIPSSPNEWQKIIAHLPIGNSPVLEGVPILPPNN
jgi:hypothetical protein